MVSPTDTTTTYDYSPAVALTGKNDLFPTLTCFAITGSGVKLDTNWQYSYDGANWINSTMTAIDEVSSAPMVVSGYSGAGLSGATYPYVRLRYGISADNTVAGKVLFSTTLSINPTT